MKSYSLSVSLLYIFCLFKDLVSTSVLGLIVCFLFCNKFYFFSSFWINLFSFFSDVIFFLSLFNARIISSLVKGWNSSLSKIPLALASL